MKNIFGWLWVWNFSHSLAHWKKNFFCFAIILFPLKLHSCQYLMACINGKASLFFHSQNSDYMSSFFYFIFPFAIIFHQLISQHLFRFQTSLSTESKKKRQNISENRKKKPKKSWVKNGKADVFLFDFILFLFNSILVQWCFCFRFLFALFLCAVVSLFWLPHCWALFQFLFTLASLFRHYKFNVHFFSLFFFSPVGAFTLCVWCVNVCNRSLLFYFY